MQNAAVDLGVDKRTKIALLWPQGFNPTYAIPLALGYLKSNLNEEFFDARIFDCAIEKIDARDPKVEDFLKDFDPDIVAVSTWSPMFMEALELLKVAKELKPEVTTVIGGAHATAYAHNVMMNKEIDYLFRGEADLSFPMFMEEILKEEPDLASVKGLMYRKDGKLASNDMEREAELDRIEIPDYDAIQLEKYVANGYRWNSPPKGNAPLWVTRGCPYRCQYCAAPQLNGRAIRKHSVDYMMKWVTDLHRERNSMWFNIIDDNFTFDIKYAKEFCRAVIKLKEEGVLAKGVGFGTPNGIRMQRGDLELWQLMKKAGWKHLIVAPESGSAHTLQLMKKDLKLGIVPKVVRDIRKAGLKVQAFFIVGYPGEKPEDLLETEKLIRKCKFNFVFLADFHPLPGTPVYDELVRKGEIVDGLLPNNFSDGQRTYTSKEFENFNFSKFILKMHVLLAVNDPLNIPYHLGMMFKLFSPKMVIKKLLFNIWAMLFPKQRSDQGKVFRPMHEQAQAAAVGASAATASSTVEISTVESEVNTKLPNKEKIISGKPENWLPPSGQ